MIRKRKRRPFAGEVIVKITTKGKALVALMDAGLLRPDAEGRIDIGPFEVFWKKFEKCLEGIEGRNQSDHGK